MCQRDGIENGRPACAAIPGEALDQADRAAAHRHPHPAGHRGRPARVRRARAPGRRGRRAARRPRRARQYHADLARRRYLAVDPANRLVAGTLEADWNTALRALNDAQEAYDKARREHAGQLTDAQKARISQLVTDLPAIWNDPATPQRERKRIARLLLTDVTVTRTSDMITAHVRLAGGQDHTLTVPAAPAHRRPAPDPSRGRHRHRRAARPAHHRRDRRHPQPARPGQRHRRTLPPAHHRPHHPRLPATQPPPPAPRHRHAHPRRNSPPPTASPTTPSKPGGEPELSPPTV